MAHQAEVGVHMITPLLAACTAHMPSSHILHHCRVISPLPRTEAASHQSSALICSANSTALVVINQHGPRVTYADSPVEREGEDEGDAGGPIQFLWQSVGPFYLLFPSSQPTLLVFNWIRPRAR